MKTKYTLLSLCIFLLVTTSTACAGWSRVTVEQIEQLIKAELPSGATKSQVVAFLNAHQISHSDYVEHHEKGIDFDDKKLDGKRHRIKMYIVATIPNVRRWSFFAHQIYMKFYFDEEGNLVDYIVRERSDGY